MEENLYNRVTRLQSRFELLLEEMGELFEEMIDDKGERYDIGYNDGMADAQPERDEFGRFSSRDK